MGRWRWRGEGVWVSWKERVCGSVGDGGVGCVGQWGDGGVEWERVREGRGGKRVNGSVGRWRGRMGREGEGGEGRGCVGQWGDGGVGGKRVCGSAEREVGMWVSR